MSAPACPQPCDPDCESGPEHCYWIHEPSHKPGWHSPENCTAPWEVWDSESGNLVFTGSETEAVAEAERLQADGACGISVGPEDDSRVVWKRSS